jgi:hypothetical protein
MCDLPLFPLFLSLPLSLSLVSLSLPLFQQKQRLQDQSGNQNVAGNDEALGFLQNGAELGSFTFGYG